MFPLTKLFKKIRNIRALTVFHFFNSPNIQTAYPAYPRDSQHVIFPKFLTPKKKSQRQLLHYLTIIAPLCGNVVNSLADKLLFSQRFFATVICFACRQFYVWCLSEPPTRGFVTLL
jgi:hypothetical protein